MIARMRQESKISSKLFLNLLFDVCSRSCVLVSNEVGFIVDELLITVCYVLKIVFHTMRCSCSVFAIFEC